MSPMAPWEAEIVGRPRLRTTDLTAFIGKLFYFFQTDSSKRIYFPFSNLRVHTEFPFQQNKLNMTNNQIFVIYFISSLTRIHKFWICTTSLLGPPMVKSRTRSGGVEASII